MARVNIKQEAHRLLVSLPEDATWEDLTYRVYVLNAVESGLEDSEAGRTVGVEQVRAKFGLSG